MRLYNGTYIPVTGIFLYPGTDRLVNLSVNTSCERAYWLCLDGLSNNLCYGW